METTTLTQRVKAKARELGFSLVGVTHSQPPAHAGVYRRWLAAGRHGEMAYLAGERAVQRRADPRLILPECQSILVLGIPYRNPAGVPKPADGRSVGRMAAFAWGQDYHEVLKPRMRRLVAFVEEAIGAPRAQPMVHGQRAAAGARTGRARRPGMDRQEQHADQS